MTKRGELMKCVICGWRGCRVFRDCDCYEMCNHSHYGTCPKCNGYLESSAFLAEQKRMGKFMNSPEGRAKLDEAYVALRQQHCVEKKVEGE